MNSVQRLTLGSSSGIARFCPGSWRAVPHDGCRPDWRPSGRHAGSPSDPSPCMPALSGACVG
eukprot:7063726-Prymnesium_polylepis.1